MPSRRRSRNKNVGNNLAEVSRRLRTLERRPVRTKLGNRIVKTSSIAPNTITADEVNFGTAVITSDPAPYIENPKDGLFVISSTTGATSVYSEEDDDFYLLADPNAQADATAASAAATEAAAAATAATASANGKNAVFRGPPSAYSPATAPTATKVGDIWFDTSPVTSSDGVTDYTGSRPKRWTGSVWEAFGLSYAAITSIDANTITTGTLTGRTIQTSANGRKIEMSNTDKLIFRGDNGVRVVGVVSPGIGSEGLDISGGETTNKYTTLSLRGEDYAGDSSATLLTPSGLGIYIYQNTSQTSYTGSGGVLINGGGGSDTTNGSLRLTSGGGGFEFVDWSGTAYGSTIYVYDDSMSISSSSLSLSADAVYLAGDLVLGYGTYQSGSGAPTEVPTGGTGTVVFRYT
jgi:hypothetical protein